MSRLSFANRGSPPQVRGKLEDALNSGSLVGITPAGAGKTLEQTRGKARDRDHPRRCGENSNSYNLHDVAWGSPPQVRGKPERADRNAVWCGITPAGAGKTVAVRMESIRLWDHPRRCGENLQQRLQQRLRLGSPPQVRGKLVDGVNANHGDRITPAGAGKTCPHAAIIRVRWDHPRRCGENTPRDHVQKIQIGSPPQVRGKRLNIFHFHLPTRITPAGAGKTL